MMKSRATRTNHSQSMQMEQDRAELAEGIEQAAAYDGVSEAQPGIYLSRFTSPTDLTHGFLEPCFCLIAQGAKALTFGGEVFRYDPAQYMISTVGLPMTAQVVEASKHRPYLGMRLTLDPAVVASVMVESGL